MDSKLIKGNPFARMDKPHLSAIVASILLSAGILHIVTASITALIWSTAGDWRSHWPHIAVNAFWITLPVSYLIWKRYGHHPFPDA